MTLALLQNIIGQLAISSKSFNYVFNGNIQEINPQSIKEYPTLVITANGPFREAATTMQYHLTFYYLDRLIGDNSNMQDIYSVGTEALRNFLIALRSLDFVVDIPFGSFQPFRATDTQVVADRCAGCYTEADITVLKNTICNEYDIPTITISGETHSVLEDYAKKVWVGQNFNKTDNFKTINGNSIIGKGNIEIEDSVTPEDLDQAISEEAARADNTYAKKSDIPSLQGYATENFVDGRVNAEATRAENTYAKKNEIPSLEGYATEQWVEGKGYLTEHQALKTINGEDIIGEGNIEIQGGSGLEVVQFNDLGDEQKRIEVCANPANYVIEYDNRFFHYSQYRNGYHRYTVFYYKGTNGINRSYVVGAIRVNEEGYGIDYSDAEIQIAQNFKTINNESIIGTGNINVGRQLIFRVDDNRIIEVPFFTRTDIAASVPFYINYTQYGTYVFATVAPASVFCDDRYEDYTAVIVRARMQKGDNLYDCTIRGTSNWEGGDWHWNISWVLVQ